jgi:hypothetical protein
MCSVFDNEVERGLPAVAKMINNIKKTGRKVPNNSMKIKVIKEV